MKNPTRRKFIAGSLALVAGTATSAQPAFREVRRLPSLVHHVFFWLKNPQSQADLNQLIAGLRTLEKIETVRAIHIGVPAKTESRPVIDGSYSVSELLFFDDLAGQKIYQDHPIHQQFVAGYSALWEKVLVYDVMKA